MNTTRQPLPDLVRAVALFGIAVVNVDFFAHATSTQQFGIGLATTVDKAVWWIVATLFTLKSYSLFAFMFGVGFEQQWRTAASEGAAFLPRYLRRMIGLLVLGLVNIVALFYGDILVAYALLGSALLLFRHATPASLRRWAVGLYIVQVLVVVLLTLSVLALATLDETALKASTAAAVQDEAWRLAGYAATDFATVADTRLKSWLEDFPFLIGMQGIGALAFMLFGLYAARTGALEDPAAAHWIRAQRVALPMGIALAAAGASVMVSSKDQFDPSFMLGFLLLTVGSPLSSYGYLGLLAAWTRADDSILRRTLMRAGGGSLTAYLLQGLMLSLLFSGYGWGLVGTLGAASYIPLAAIVAMLSLLFVSAWRARYAQAPCEALLRAWVYLGARRVRWP
jgi:uncharacterized protein